MTLDAAITQRLRLPLIAAPMLRVSGPDLVSAACRSGVIGAFPTVNARTTDGLDAWLTRIERECEEAGHVTAPVCPNIIMRSDPAQLREDIGVLVKHRVPMVIASVGSPKPIIAPLHDVGCKVLTDVASIKHAEKALEAGADGLVLLSAGAGGQTGWVNGMSFVRAVRAFYDGPIVLSGGISDGAALWSAQTLGCDLGMMGTRFIATPESMAAQPYKTMLVESRLDDVMLTRAVTGLQTNILRPSVERAGLDPRRFEGGQTDEQLRELQAQFQKDGAGPRRWVDLWSSGHTVSAVGAVTPVAELVADIEAQYREARQRTRALLNQ